MYQQSDCRKHKGTFQLPQRPDRERTVALNELILLGNPPLNTKERCSELSGLMTNKRDSNPQLRRQKCVIRVNLDGVNKFRP